MARPPPLPSGSNVVHVVGAAIVQDGRCLVGRRIAGGSSGGKWEFPGGKVQPSEAPEEALQRETQEELEAHVTISAWLGRGTAQPDHRVIVLDVYLAHAEKGWASPQKNAHDEFLWSSPENLLCLDWAEADIPIVPSVLAHLKTTRLRIPAHDDR